MSENNDNSSDSNSRGDVVAVLQTSRLNPIRSGVLRPSLFASNLNAANATAATDGNDAAAAEEEVKVNPFLKGDNSLDTSVEGGEPKAEDEKPEEEDKNEEKADPLALLTKNGLPKSNLFAGVQSSIPRVQNSGFVFGQNVHERVTGENISSTGESSTSTSENQTENNDNNSSLFASVIQNTKTDTDANLSEETEKKSLDEVAREYEESRAQKRKYEEVETFTGEENEINIVDISCKLFAFVNSNWEERGRGSLRLNDPKDEDECSRVVFRTSGNLRLLVNTKVWHGMVGERSSPKSLRFTAMDNAGQIKIWLAMSRPDDINILHKALVQRIETQKELHPNSEVNENDSNNGTVENSEENSSEPNTKKIAAE